MNIDPIPSTLYASNSRSYERRRLRRAKYLQVPAETRPGDPDSVSNRPFTGSFIALTAKRLLPALRRSIRSCYERHVGLKQLAKWEMRNEDAALKTLAAR